MPGKENENASIVEDELSSLRKVLTSLDVRKRAIETEAEDIILELNSPSADGIEPIGLDRALVDADGYPRDDVDVYRARILRNRFRILQSDHKEMQNKIGCLLVELAKKRDNSKEKAEVEETALRLAPKPKPKYDSVTGKWVVQNWDGSVAGIKDGNKIKFDDLCPNRDMGLSSNQTSEIEITNSLVANESISRPIRKPFAKVDGVSNPSPAADAGMKLGDFISRFGNLHINSHNRLQAVAKLVPEVAANNGRIQITVLRRRRNDRNSHKNESSAAIIRVHETNFVDGNWEEIELTLHPRPFSGRGLLGCHIIPFDPQCNSSTTNIT